MLKKISGTICVIYNLLTEAQNNCFHSNHQWPWQRDEQTSQESLKNELPFDQTLKCSERDVPLKTLGIRSQELVYSRAENDASLSGMFWRVLGSPA